MTTREEHLKFCTVCTNRTFNTKYGVVCRLTHEVAAFENSCPDYIEDEKEVRIEGQKVATEISEKKTTINKGRSALFIVAGLYVIVGVVEGFFIEGHDILYGIIDWFAAAVFVGFGIWSFYRPYLALIAGLSFYGLLILLIFALDPTTIFSGIIWKVFIIYALVSGIKTAKTEEVKRKRVSDDILDQL